MAARTMQPDAAQLPLFESRDAVLVDDERGEISYTPALVSQATAHEWFAQLRRDVQWRAERRTMYEREVDVPRLIAHFRLGPSPVAIPTAILDAARRVTDHVGAPFNSVGLNLYRDGRDSVAPHNDHLSEIRRGFPIALLSLGAKRRMTIRAKAEPKRVIHVDLEAGSLLVMDYDTQLHYTHAVPKTPRTVGERISLAFRVKREKSPAADSSVANFYR
jgi:alkylated DNA repair dioxygenase AlkB